VWDLTRSRLSELSSSRETLILYVRPPAPLTTDRASENLRFVKASPADGVRYARDIGTESPSTFRARLAPDVHCYLVTEGDTVLHSSWLTTSGAWTREIGSYLSPPPGDAYVYESFTGPRARGRGIYPFALAGIMDRCKGDGVKLVWVGVESRNAPSIRAITKAGFEEGFRLPYARRYGKVSLEPPEGPRSRTAIGFLDVPTRPQGPNQP
jgi:GNAT superfamily N-acetyltransferase